MSSTDSPSVALNNYLQDKGRLAALTWVDRSTGPRHAPEWESQCKLDGVVIATGRGMKMNLAHDAAAKVALAILIARETEGASASQETEETRGQESATGGDADAAAANSESAT
ncbi:hypothetical protein C8Q77DRAFT_1152809 [Trametes polyzona]|nr:hypothetical protein C8Q77DRAFT_1152809 [Trametes polyzona]